MYSVALLKSIAKGGLGWYAALRKALKKKQSKAIPNTQPPPVKTVVQTAVPAATVTPAANNSVEVPVEPIVEVKTAQAVTESAEQGESVQLKPTDSQLETEVTAPENSKPSQYSRNTEYR